MIDVSIIFVNYNCVSLLTAAIDSVLDKTVGVSYEIIVVDNNSTDGSRQVLLERYGQKTKYVALSENVGFGRANNEAIKISKGKNVFLLNPDTILINNAVKILSEYLDSNPAVGVCCGNLYSNDLKPAFSHYKFLPSLITEIDALLYHPLESVFKNIQHNYSDHPIAVQFVSGADFMTRREILNKTGYFDTDFFLYYEDTELSHRILKCGYKFHNVPSAKIIHLEGKSFEDNERRMFLTFQGRNIFHKKAHGKLHNEACNFVNMLTILSRLTFFKLSKKQIEYNRCRKRLELYVKAREQTCF